MTKPLALPLGELNPSALRKAKIVYWFGLSECNRVKRHARALPDFLVEDLTYLGIATTYMAQIKLTL